MSISHHAFRHYLWTTSLEVVKGATLLASAWILKEEGRGLFSLAYILPNVVLIFGSLGLEAAGPYMMGKKIASEVQVGSSMVWGAMALGFFWMLVTGAIMSVDGVVQAEVTWPMRFLVLATMPFALMRQSLTALMVHRRWIARSVLLNALQRTGNLLALLAIGLILIPNGLPTELVVGLLWCQLAILILTVGIGLWMQRDWVLGRPQSNLFLRMLRFGFFQALSVSAMYLLHSGDQYLLGKLGGAESIALVGIYSAAFGLLSMVSGVSKSITQIFFRIGVEHEGSERTQIALDVGRRTVVVVSLISIGMAVAVWPLMLLLPTGFAEVPYILCILLLSAPLYALGQMPDSAMIAQGKVSRSVIAPVISVVVNILLNIWWIPLHGMYGAAWATVVSFGLLGFLRLALFARIGPGFEWGRALGFGPADFRFVLLRGFALVRELRKRPPSNNS